MPKVILQCCFASALCSLSITSAHAAATASDLEPCLVSSANKGGSWRAVISRRAAIFIIRHVQNACRIIVTASSSPTLGPILLQLQQARADLNDEVLVPIYKARPGLRKHAAQDGKVHPVFKATRADIGLQTAARLESAISQIRKRLGDAAREHAQQITGIAKAKQDAVAIMQPLTDISAEISIATKPAYDAYPILWKASLTNIPAQPRTAESDAEFRKATPPLGSVKLSEDALKMVKAFMREVHAVNPTAAEIASINWSADQQSRGPEDPAWTHLGPGLVLGTWARTQVPSDVIDHVDGVAVIFSAENPSIFIGKTVDFKNGRFFIRD